MKTKIYFFVILFFLPFFSFGQTTIYTNYNLGNVATGEGTSGNPYKTFHKAYTQASSGDIIDLTGTFDWTNADETGDASTTGYSLLKNLTIKGQSAAATIIQAASSSGSADRSLFTINDGYTITFENLTMRWGNISNSGSYMAGGITAIASAVINMKSCDMLENRISCSSTAGYGVAGAIASTGWNRVTHTFTSCTFKDNQAIGKGFVGGTIELYEGKAGMFENCTFDGNQATCNKEYSGHGLAAGAVFQYYRASAASEPYHKYTNCTFYNNSADAGAGAIFTVTGGADRDYFTNCTMVNNSVSVGGSGGIAGGDPYSGTYTVKIYIENTIIANNINESGSGDDIDLTVTKHKIFRNL